VDSTGNINIIEAALAKGVKKFILVTSIGCGDTKDAPGEQVRCACSCARACHSA
jgi:nucleoside-diphosphate-sugar epimerase